MSDYAKKTNRVSQHRATFARRAERRADAIERAAERAKRSPAQQATLLDGRPGASAKERARLAAGGAA